MGNVLTIKTGKTKIKSNKFIAASVIEGGKVLCITVSSMSDAQILGAVDALMSSVLTTCDVTTIRILEKQIERLKGL